MTNMTLAPESEPVPAKLLWYRRKLVWGGLGAVLIVLGVAVVLIASQPSNLQTAASKCKVEGSQYANVADGGNTLTLDGESDAGGDGLTIAKLGCVLRELKISTAVVTQMDDTTSLQGRQTGAWNDIHASWTYSPNNGLDIILTHK